MLWFKLSFNLTVYSSNRISPFSLISLTYPKNDKKIEITKKSGKICKNILLARLILDFPPHISKLFILLKSCFILFLVNTYADVERTVANKNIINVVFIIRPISVLVTHKTIETITGIIVISYKDRELLELVTTPLVYLGYKDEQEKNKALEITKRVVFLKECLYKEKKDANYLKYLYLIRDGKSIYDEVSYDLLDKEFINDKTCLEIVRDCNVTFPKASLLLPIYDCPNNLDADTYLRELAIKGLTRRLKGNVLKNYSDRLIYELSIIKKMGFSNNFLVVYDFIL